MISPRKWGGKRWYMLTAFVSATVVVSGLFLAPQGSASSSGQVVVHTAITKTGHEPAGRIVHPATSSKPFVPTAAERAARARDMNYLAKLPRPPIGKHTTAASVARLRGAQTSVSSKAPTNFTVFKTSAIAASCTTDCAQSSVNEPDTANAGKYIVQTSNWDIADSTSGGGTWVYQDPYSLSSGFCCDQTVTYVPSRDRFIYEGLTLGTGTTEGFSIAVSETPSAWCVYHFDASSFGGTAGDLLDYPKIAYSNNFLYITWNHYLASTGAWSDTGLARFPLDPLASCAGFSYNYLTRNDNFTFGLTYGASSLDTFYWVSNWYTSGSGSGTSERIYAWPENSGSYIFNDIGVTAYNFSGGSCASQDGVVTNWCSRLDPRWETAWISRAEYNANNNSAFAGDTILGVAITAGPGGGDPFPYVIYEYFKLNARSFIQTSATFNDGFAFAYAGCAPDSLGYVGCTMSWGGGTGTTHYYPGGLVLVQDNTSPTQPWAFSFNLSGAGNATAWGDYMVTQPTFPDTGPFITTEWSVNSSGTVQPKVVIWGRGLEQNGYKRWKGK